MAKEKLGAARAEIRDDPALRADGARTDIDPGDQPGREEFTPHVNAREREAEQHLDVSFSGPGQQNTRFGDPLLDEANEMVLPTDDREDSDDVPVMDLAVDEPAFPLVDRAPINNPDTAVGDVEDENRLEDELRESAEADDPITRRRL